MDSAREEHTRRSAMEISDWLVEYMASLLDLPEERVDVTMPFDRFGLDSAAAVALSSDLATWIGRDVDPNVTAEYQTIAALSAHLAD